MTVDYPGSDMETSSMFSGTPLKIVEPIVEVSHGNTMITIPIMMETTGSARTIWLAWLVNRYDGSESTSISH